MNSRIDYSGLRFALFDFDGTVSLIRSGWQDVMIPYFCEVMRATGTAEQASEIHALVKGFVDALTGKQTIYQCMALRDEVLRRGAPALSPGEYKAEYLRRLEEKIRGRKLALADGSAPPDGYTVPGAADYLAALRGRGVVCCCASGTDEPDVRREAELLGVAEYFDGGIFGATADLTDCSKEAVIRRLLSGGVDPAGLITFGDGFVEIELTKAAGGFAVGVATDETNRSGEIDREKAARLARAGADMIIPDFTCLL